MIEQPPDQWLRFLDRSFRTLVSMRPLDFGNMKPSRIPDVPGVYIITGKVKESERPYYVGRSKNLRQRLYNNHLMGPKANARLKKYLIDSGECSNMQSAKNFIRENCLARWIEESDLQKRGAIEGYATALLSPKYGIYEEH